LNYAVPGPVDNTTEFFESITQSIHNAKPWQIPGSVNSTCNKHFQQSIKQDNLILQM